MWPHSSWLCCLLLASAQPKPVDCGLSYADVQTTYVLFPALDHGHPKETPLWSSFMEKKSFYCTKFKALRRRFSNLAFLFHVKILFLVYNGKFKNIVSYH